MVRGSGKGDDIGKIFVGGLAPDTDELSLQEYFEQYGVVTDSVVMRDTTTKRSRGFGFVTFKEPESVQKTLGDKPHVLGGKTIDPKPAVPRGPGQQGPPPPVRGGGGGGSNDQNKVFVGGLPQNITEEGLANYFSAVGQVVNTQLIFDPDTGKMRGFGFVTFASPEPAKNAADKRFHEINGKTVEVKKIEDRGRGRGRGGMQMNQRNPLAQPSHGGGMPGMYGPPGQYGGNHYHAQGPGYGQGPGMGRGFNPGGYGGYGAPGQPMGPGSAPGYAAPPPAASGYGYAGVPTAGMPTAGFESGGYGRGVPPRDAGVAAPYAQAPGAENGTGYGAGFGAVSPAGGAPPAVPAATSGAYDQYSQMPATSSALPTPGGVPPRVEGTPTPDYSAYSSYALGSSYQQQDSQYGPARTSLDSSGSYAGYGLSTAADSTYPSVGAGAGGGAGGFDGGSFARGGGNVSRGYHPYGR